MVAVYGGFFGAGVGIVMLASLGTFRISEPREANALKPVGDVSVNGVALLLFWALGWVEWRPAVVLALGCLLGGYVGARIGRRIGEAQLRALVIAVGAALTAYFFVRSTA